jgi:MSHA pilin protein MshD
MSAMVLKPTGFTLIEMIITIVVISVGLSGVLLAFQVVVKSSADPLVTKQLMSIAEAQMEGVMLKEFSDITNDSTCNTCPAGYTSSITVTSGVLWEGIPDTKTIKVDVTSGTQTFQLTNHRTNYAP